MRSIKKDFFGNQVLTDINLTLAEGEVLGLCGENGAGKSTLMKILFGMDVIRETGGYEGEILLNGKPVRFATPFDALAAGIGMVHQEFSLIPGFTATENILLNREPKKRNVISEVFGERLDTLDYNEMTGRAEAAIDKMGFKIDKGMRINEMPVGHKQFTEIARELSKDNLKLLILDEPTAVLTEKEADALLSSIRSMSEKGIAVIFITHRLHEILSVCDKVVVMRDGYVVSDVPAAETSVSEISKWMVGRSVENTGSIDIRDTSKSKTMMSIRNLWVDMPGETVRNVTLDIKEGEILGIGGLAGQGKLGIANGLMGMYPVEGKVTYKGQPLDVTKTNETLKKGIAFLSEDRKGVGLLLSSPIELNIAFSAMEVNNKFLKSVGPFKLTDKQAIRENAEKMVKDLDIRCTSTLQNAGALSGGNQQKVCLGKALTLDPELLLVSEPTRGIDIGAKKLILDLLKQLAEERGMTIIMTSSELAELRSICDRVLIICEGKVAGELSPMDSDEVYGLMMSGVSKEEAMKAGGVVNE